MTIYFVLEHLFISEDCARGKLIWMGFLLSVGFSTPKIQESESSNQQPRMVLSSYTLVDVFNVCDGVSQNVVRL